MSPIVYVKTCHRSEEQFWSKSSENDDETLNEVDNQSIAL